jgi:hypothetical protein
LLEFFLQPLKKKMSNDDPVPQSLTDFVFDLYDSVTLSQLTEEQTNLYGNTFRDLSAKVCTYVGVTG